MSELLTASCSAKSFVSFVSAGEAGAGAAVEDEAEEREGMVKSTDEAESSPKRIMSMATLFFFSFLPSCRRACQRWIMSSQDAKRTLTSEAWVALKGLPTKTMMR